jgi:hypothetical protein
MVAPSPVRMYLLAPLERDLLHAANDGHAV